MGPVVPPTWLWTTQQLCSQHRHQWLVGVLKTCPCQHMALSFAASFSVRGLVGPRVLAAPHVRCSPGLKTESRGVAGFRLRPLLPLEKGLGGRLGQCPAQSAFERLELLKC